MEDYIDLNEIIGSWPFELAETGKFIPFRPNFFEELKRRPLKVAIVDTGINISHSCFKNATIVNKDFSGGSNPYDEIGHGTHCAAILVGKQSKRFVGLVPETIIYSAKIIGRYSKELKYPEKSMGNAIRWAISNNVNFILITMGRTKTSPYVKEYINEAMSKGIIIIASAGNHGGSLPLFPSNVPGVICVSALGRNRLPVPECYSGGYVKAFVPGETIVSAKMNGEYREMSGSSQAAAIFCGLLVKKVILE